MAISAYLDDEQADEIGQARAQLLTDLAAGIKAMQRAAATLEQLCA